MSAPDIAGFLENSKVLDRLRKEQEEILFEINKLHNKLQSIPEVVEKPGDNSIARLRILYTQARELSENELILSGQLLGQLDALMPSGPPGQQRRRIDGNEQKRKRMKADSDISRIPTSVRNRLDALASLEGQEVAARVTQEDADKDEWFIVKVIHFDRETREFEVLDEEPGEDEEGSGQRKYKVPMSHIIPFPKQNDPSTSLEFPPGKHVLAVYPKTTALYRATVIHAPKRKTDPLKLGLVWFTDFGIRERKVIPFLCLVTTNFGKAFPRDRKIEGKVIPLKGYVLEFDDDEENGSLPQRNIPFHQVVALPQGHRQ
ncbi:hypothetical protein LguiB_011388 [Lonicera macranthoides]